MRSNDRSTDFLLDIIRELTRDSASDLSSFYTYASSLASTTLLDWVGKTAGERVSLITNPDEVERTEMVKIIDNICIPFIRTMSLERVPLVKVNGFVSTVTQRVAQRTKAERMQTTQDLKK